MINFVKILPRGSECTMLAGRGLGIPFIHIPPICICKQVLFFFFNKAFLLFTNSKNILHMTSVSVALSTLLSQT